MKIKRLIAAFAALLMVGSLVPAQPVQAAAKTSVDVVTAKTGVDDGSVTKYSYNKNGLISKSVSKNKKKSNTSEKIMTQVEYSYGSDGDANTYTSTYAVYGTEYVKSTEEEKAVTTYKYVAKGKAAGKIKKKVVTTYYTTKYSVKTDTNSDSYDEENTYGYTVTAKVTAKTTYSYNKKGMLKKRTQVDTAPMYYTYKSLTGSIATEYPAGEDSEYRNGASYCKDNLVITSVLKFSSKGDHYTKSVATVSEKVTDIEVDDGVTTKEVVTSLTDNVKSKYTYKKGNLRKMVSTIPGEYTYIYEYTNLSTSESAKSTEHFKYAKSKQSTVFTYDKDGCIRKVDVNQTDGWPVFSAQSEVTTSNDAGTVLVTNTSYTNLSYMNVANKYTRTNEFEFKSGSNRVKKGTTVVSAILDDGEKDSSCTLERDTYKIKTKKVPKKYAEAVEIQQQGIQGVNVVGDFDRY
ncbi:MAG: hypothetical protein K5840_01525 [Eubacterium sp.]|nr:hypothetical protein [Eubacterium sp.]